MSYKSRVSKARKFLGSLSLVLAIASFNGCASNRNDYSNNKRSYKHEILNESEEISNDFPDISPDEKDQEVKIPNIGDYQGNLLEEALFSSGYPYDYFHKKQLALLLGIPDYRGTIDQDSKMLEMLKNYAMNHKSADSKDIENNQTIQKQSYEKSDNGHYKIIYEESIDGSFMKVISKTLEDHNYTNLFVAHDKENKDGYDEVIYGYCDDCGALVEISRKYISNNKKHNHKYKLVLEKGIINDLGELGHSETNYYECSCREHYTVDVKKPHLYLEPTTRYENVTKDGYDLVIYQVCGVCNHENIISREHVDTKECDHSYTYEIMEHENETEYDHDEVIYEICFDCGKRTEKSRNKVNHVYYDEVVDNKDGTHSVVRHYICSTGEKYDKVISKNYCQYTTIYTTHENETEEGYDLVTYVICDICNHRHEISREYISTNECEHNKIHEVMEYENETKISHDEVIYIVCDDCGKRIEKSRNNIVHPYDERIVDNNNGMHSLVRTYKCSNGATYEEILDASNCTYDSIITRHENETEEGYDLVTYKVCSICHHEYEISREYVSKICKHEKTHEVVEYENETETSHDEVIYKVCDDCGSKTEISRKKITHTYTDRVVDNKDGTHSVIRTYNGSDGKKYEKIISTNDHSYERELTRHENETKEGYDLVTYKVCNVCHHEHIISREYISKTCNHKKTHEVVEYENETETSHDEVTYQVCDDCGHKTEKSRKNVTHRITDGIIKSNKDGTHSFTRTYTCSNGKTYTKEITVNCSYVKQPVVIENEKAESHDEVVYEICSICNHKVEVSRKTINHDYIDKTVDNGNGTHSVIRTYTCSNGKTYDKIISTSNHNMQNVGNITYNAIGNDQHQLISDQKCSDCSKTLSGVIIGTENCKPTNDKYTGNINGSMVDYQICSDCGQNIKIKAHTNHNGTWIQSSREGYHEKHCTACNQDIYEQCNMIDELDANGVKTGSRCSVCGRYIKIEVVQHSHNWSEVKYVVWTDGLVHEIRECLNYNENCDQQYWDLGVHNHNYVWELPYKPTGEGTHSKSNGSCACGDVGTMNENCTWVLDGVKTDLGNRGTVYYTKCQFCNQAGPEQFVAKKVEESTENIEEQESTESIEEQESIENIDANENAKILSLTQ